MKSAWSCSRQVTGLAIALLLTACGRGSVEPSQVLVTVNADEVTVHQLNFALAKTHGDGVRVNIAPVLDCWVSSKQFIVGCHNFLRCATHAVTASS